MDVGIFVPVEIRQAIDHRIRFLRGGGVVEPDQLPAVNALLQDRKILADQRGSSGRLATPSSAVKIGANSRDSMPAVMIWLWRRFVFSAFSDMGRSDRHPWNRMSRLPGIWRSELQPLGIDEGSTGARGGD